MVNNVVKINKMLMIKKKKKHHGYDIVVYPLQYFKKKKTITNFMSINNLSKVEAKK